MKKIILLAITVLAGINSATAQVGASKDTSWKKVYRASPTIENDLIHTKLECRFDYDKSWMYGKVWITAKPHFYDTDKITLDALGMTLNKVAIANGTALKTLNDNQYDYNGSALVITLPKKYTRNEKFTIYVDYIAKPDELSVQGSAAISDAKGLYFINPKGEIPGKPIQIWTQGETQATSAWCPTIDRSNQKTTQEIYMTVPAKYVTLSNGIMKSSKKNTDGTRTDYWQMDLPHAPYLFFMGVGDFAIVKDKPYKGKEVSYYVEKDQAKYALQVFGNTPEMMKFFSEKLGVDYPWQKYAQIVGRDYVSGAMENTTATLHQESAYQNDRELADGNSWEGTIAHELFHQWFGDLVTTESWSNLTVNESFADYSEYLWDEYKYGKDKADEVHFGAMQSYLFGPGNESKHLARFYYADKEDMFDGVSYAKGGRILHMLRKYLGDDAFFAGLKNYLTTNKFKTGEAHQLRLALEETSGKDLNWFFNTWYFGSGHPKFDVKSSYDVANEKVTVVVAQTQTTGKLFQIPVDIDIYNGKTKKRYTVWLTSSTDTFTFNSGSKPTLVDFDGDRILLCTKKEDKGAEQYIAQYENNANYLARREALEYFGKNKMKELSWGLGDKYAGLRQYTYNTLAGYTNKQEYYTEVMDRLVTEKSQPAKAAGLKFLAKAKDSKYKSLFEDNLGAKSYTVAGAALEGLDSVDQAASYVAAKRLSNDAKRGLATTINNILVRNATEADFDYFDGKMKNGALDNATFSYMSTYVKYLSKIKDLGKVKQGLQTIRDFLNKIPASFREELISQVKQMVSPVGKAHGSTITDHINDIFK
jgi:aminopeptidase N